MTASWWYDVCCKADTSKYADLGGVVCLRKKGHDGPCMTLARDAGIADQFCWICRRPYGKPHTINCMRVNQPNVAPARNEDDEIA